MARNEIFRDADHLSLPVPSGTGSGAPVRVGGLNGVTETARGEGGNASGHASVWLKGAHEFDVDFAVADVGDPVYIDASGDLTDEEGSDPANALYGHALTTKPAAAGPLTVRIAN